ncbi:hypothetical protein Rleg2_6209 (plasmid) [Rhizobium leguminosarum bv. trifolii WSM2304]|uniref:TrbH/VirB7-like conjugative transfer protein n=1 Tax=Rhizobium leguminosarum bv. trifolii (strain WSM2304) TaxID=395492 RepID=A0ABF7QZF0_RHILW|nr:hypothetical protein [Rhizobium leguminosarum]ACI59585.1 hypothetical protein Rleg2_6209 [Rhizobium leguminosarum bv. trifolii WSM2304]
MRLILVLVLGCVTLSGCAGKQEQLAKCSADDNPVPALGFDKELKPARAEQALAAAVANDCGPMRPVNQF